VQGEKKRPGKRMGLGPSPDRTRPRKRCPVDVPAVRDRKNHPSFRIGGSQKDNETIKIHVPFILFSKNLWPAAQPLRSSRTFQHIEVEGACPLAPTRQMKMAFGSILKIPRSPRQMESRGMNPNPKKPTRNPEITCRHDT
jgi:hypothetical protein